MSFDNEIEEMIQRQVKIKEMKATSSHWCSYCESPFSSKKYLIQHQQRTRICKKYKDALFHCQRCNNYRTKGIRNLDAHLESCKGGPPICVDNTMDKLTAKLKLLERENDILKGILQSISNIEMDKLFLAKRDELELFNLTPETKIFLSKKYPDIEEKILITKELVPIVEKSDISGMATYRRPNKNLRTSQELELKEKDELIKNIEEKRLISLGPLSNALIEEVIIQCDTFIDQLASSRVYSKILKKLRVERSKLLTTLGLEKYQELTQKHVDRLYKVFEGKKQTDKKIKTIIKSSLTSLELRLLKYPGYTDTQLDTDYQESLETLLRHGSSFPKSPEPYSSQEICYRITNYTVALFPIEKLIRWALINPYNEFNVVYLSLSRSMPNDPFSFYTYRETKKGKRNWDMDCRLEDLTTDLIGTIQPYLVSLFRELYYSIFNDNNYYTDYQERSTFAAEDCEQLAQNIILLSQPRKLNAKLRNLVMTECTIQCTGNDLFNLFSDDPLQKKNFAKKEIVEMVGTVRQLFDQITDEQAVIFYKSRDVA